MRLLEGHTDTVRCVDFSPDGSWLASGSDDGTVRFWNARDWSTEAFVHDIEFEIETIAFSPDSEEIVAGIMGGEIVHWNRGSRKEPRHHHGTGSIVRCLAYHPAGNWIYCVGWDEALAILDARTISIYAPGSMSIQVDDAGAIPRPLNITGLAVAPTGVAFCCGALGVYSCTVDGNLADVEKLDSAYSIAVSPDGAQLAIGTTTGDIILKEIGVKQMVLLAGHTWTIYGLRFTPDGRQLVSISADGTTRVWDIGRRCERHCFRWRPKWPVCLAIAPDGMTAATGSADGTIVVWDVPDD